jgi:hypothetical protein
MNYYKLEQLEEATKDVKFDAEQHSYTYQGKKMISCTQLLEKMGITKSFKDIGDLPQVRAARDRGIRIHSEIASLLRDIGNGIKIDTDMPVSSEAALFHKWFTEEQHSYISNYSKEDMQKGDIYPTRMVMSEKIVFSEEYMVAGTIDGMWGVSNGDIVIIDFKTGSIKGSVWGAAWQLALYRYMLCETLVSPEYREFKDHLPKLIVFSFYFGLKTETVDYDCYDVSDYISNDDVKELLDAYKEGKEYDVSLKMLQVDHQRAVVEATKILESVKKHEDIVKGLKLQLQAIKADLYAVMDTRKVKTLKIKTSDAKKEITLTRVDSFFRKTLDSAALKEQKPDIYEQYCKMSQIDPSVRIAVKELKDEKSIPVSSDAFELE